MGKKAPAAPDPYATAQAQGQMNVETARTQAALNRGNTYTPFGSVTNRNIGNDQWESNVTLSPEQARIYNQGVELDTGANSLALDMLPEARRTLMQPMATDDPDARNRATTAILSRLEPQFERDRTALDSRLIAQGFQPGTEAYRQAADELSRARTDARLQADALGSAESRNAAGFANAMRGQRVNELGMLFGLGPGMQTPQAQQLAPVGINAPDYQNAVAQNYAQQTQQYGANQGALFGLLGAGFGAATGNPWLAKSLFR